jgi:RND superfamily putative drug exporter
VDDTFEDIARVSPIALFVVFAVLAVFLRALVAPLYLLAASVLSLFAALGMTVFIFQHLLGRGELTYYVPFAAAVLLLSLGSDYNVFIVGRIWQEAARRRLREAIVVGGARAATPITVAGLILAASFALLWLVPVSGFQELACAMALGLLIDAFLVRTLLVPALIALVGERSGWPGHALRPGWRVPADIGSAPHAGSPSAGHPSQ